MKKLLQFFVYLSVFLFAAFLIKSAQATTFPVSELGNCRDYQECHLYCAIPKNQAACWSYKVYVQHGQVLAEESGEDKVKALGITFPITELGGCNNINECKAFCDDSANKDACMAFSKKKGLDKKQSLVERAKADLGCNSIEECKTFCAEETNKDACETFAKKYNLKGPAKQPLLEAAKTELGCTSLDACKQFCATSENKEKCEALGKKFGVKDERRETLVETAKRELGCTSFEDCKAFCQNKENQDKCRNFGTAVRSKLPEVIKEQLKELGECKSVEECRKVCAENPGKCPGFPGRTSPQPVPFKEGSGSAEARKQYYLDVQNRLRNEKPGSAKPTIQPGSTRPVKPELQGEFKPPVNSVPPAPKASAEVETETKTEDANLPL